MGLFWQSMPAGVTGNPFSAAQLPPSGLSLDGTGNLDASAAMGMGLGIGLSIATMLAQIFRPAAADMGGMDLMSNNLMGNNMLGASTGSPNNFFQPWGMMATGAPTMANYGALGMDGSTAALVQSINTRMGSALSGLGPWVQNLIAQDQMAKAQKAAAGQTEAQTGNGNLVPYSASGSDTHDHTEEETGSDTTETIAAVRNPDGSNVRATETLADYKNRFGVTSMGIWGDKEHQKRRSDHNSGDAVDLGIHNDLDLGQKVADALVSEAKERGIKYVIFNKRIWTPSEGWHAYSKAASMPHTDHVHVSFNR